MHASHCFSLRDSPLPRVSGRAWSPAILDKHATLARHDRSGCTGTSPVDDARGPLFYFSSSIGFDSTPTPSMSISQVSPGFIQIGGLRGWPTPDGVPVKQMSPGSSVMPCVR